MHTTGARISTVIAVALALGGCAAERAAGPDAAEKSLALANSQSAFGYETPDWGTPFWERLGDKVAQAKASAPAGAADSRQRGPADADTLRPSPNQEPMTPYAGTPAIVRPAATASATAEAAGDEALHASVALDWPVGQPEPPALAALARQLSAAGFVVIPPGALHDAIGDAPGCDEITRPACLASLARYPAPRLLIVARPASNGQLSLVTYDTQFGARYPASEVAMRAQDDGLARVTSAARRRVDVAPWFTRSFAERDQRYYLAAGAASGLQAGDRLAVHNQGELVRGPAGQPVVWESGQAAGQLEVMQLLGDDTSVARAVDTADVRPTSLLVAEP